MQPDRTAEMRAELNALIMMSAHMEQMTRDLLSSDHKITKTAGALKYILMHELRCLDVPELMNA